jgi:hypothetical protein
MLKSFLSVLKKILPVVPLDHPSLQDPRRKVQALDYLALFFLGVLNPVVRTMRGLCAASHLEKIQQICAFPISQASFSEMQHLINPELLEQVFKHLGQEVEKRHPGPPGQTRWRVVDSSLFKALNRMAWAKFRRNHSKQDKAVRLNVSLDLWSGAVTDGLVSPARTCERKAWKEQWHKDYGHIGDRNYGEDYGLMRLLDRREQFFLLRLRVKKLTVAVEEELEVSAQDRAARVKRQAWGYLGTEKYRSERVRLIWIASEKEDLLLVTNQNPEEMPGWVASELYRKRWQVELYFRWIKCILGCRHFLAESKNGVAIELYLVLIAALLLQLHLGCRPNKRMLELCQWYFLGVATRKELAQGILRQRELLAKQQAAKKSA